ncbi:MAG TPA: GMC family oxidoreductase [Solirubrobacteraceae bacterium]|jgi:choline dehydrogenase-like flavoprotein|nr:GMC family oxidoreductase [Solirubrobacteraceae bacterium]
MEEERYEVVVVGSGAGGGVVAGELAARGRSVLLIELGPHRTAIDFQRWESKAAHDLWWPIRFAMPAGEWGHGPVALIGGRCVGGSTTINTKVAMRAIDADVAKWHEASGLLGDSGEPFSTADLEPWYERVESYLGVRARDDWSDSVRTVERGFKALGGRLESVESYTDQNCTRIGSCLQGCPTNGGKSTQNTYIARALADGSLVLRPQARVERVLIEDSADGAQATGVEYSDSNGRHRVQAGAVVVAAGTLNTPGLLARSGLEEPLIGRNLGFHPARLVFGRFAEPQDAHIVYPITTHYADRRRDADGGFVIEAVTMQDPIGFAVNLQDEHGPIWGEPLVEALRAFRNWSGLLAMVNDDNNGAVIPSADWDSDDAYSCDFSAAEVERLDGALDFSRRALEAAGAEEVLWTGLVTTHIQGSCRMGSDPARSVVDAHGEMHSVRRLFVGDGSVIPRTVSANPSLTIMALATRLADHLDADASGYLASLQAAAA